MFFFVPSLSRPERVESRRFQTKWKNVFLVADTDYPNYFSLCTFYFDEHLQKGWKQYTNSYKKEANCKQFASLLSSFFWLRNNSPNKVCIFLKPDNNVGQHYLLLFCAFDSGTGISSIIGHQAPSTDNIWPTNIKCKCPCYTNECYTRALIVLLFSSLVKLLYAQHLYLMCGKWQYALLTPVCLNGRVYLMKYVIQHICSCKLTFFLVSFIYTYSILDDDCIYTSSGKKLLVAEHNTKTLELHSAT